MSSLQNDSTLKPAADRILMYLKMRGPQSSISVGTHLGITGEAARQHLLRLGDQGLVSSVAIARGVGRPMAMWQLTDHAQRRFPDTHAQLTVDLIASIRDELGEASVTAVVRSRERASLAHYRSAMVGAATLRDRVARLASIRSDEGYMAEWWEDSDGSITLVENHCPICAAADSCQEFCRAELRVFQDVLGDGVTIERTDHILAGARRCAYRIGRVSSA